MHPHTKRALYRTYAQAADALARTLPTDPPPADRGDAPTGFASPAASYAEPSLSPTQYLMHHPAASFWFTMQGHSMHGAGILDGDKVLVDRSLLPRHGQIVVVVVDGEHLVRRLLLHTKTHSTKQPSASNALTEVTLQAEHPDFAPLRLRVRTLNELPSLQVWGPVVGLMRRYEGYR